MRIPRSFRAAALIAAAALLGLLAVQGTYALWSSTAVATPGTVTGADFTVYLLGSPSSQTTAMTLADGQPGTLALTTSAAPAADLLPGTSIYTAVSASNDSNAGGTFSVTLTAGPAALANTGGGALAQYLTVSAATSANATNCSHASGYQALATTTFTSAPIAKGASAVMCFKVQLSSSAPSSVKGQTVNISVPLTANQVCGVPGGCA